MLNQWNNGFAAEVRITNLGAPVTGGWVLTWSFAGNQQIASVWSAVITQSSQQVTAWNSGANPAPAHFALNGMPCIAGVPTPMPTPTPTRTPGALVTEHL